MCLNCCPVWITDETVNISENISILDTEKNELIQKIADQTLEKAINRNEMLRLLVYFKSLKRADSANTFECYVIYTHPFNTYAQNHKS